MQPRVTAVLVARNGGQYLPRTLAALAAQTRRPDSVILVDAVSTDSSHGLLEAAAPQQVLVARGRRTFGGAVGYAVKLAPPQSVEDEWLWLLGHDNAPEPGALSAMLGAVEVAPSVAIAGPKLMRWDDASVIASFGETMTAFGRSIDMVSGELDQAQHDVQSDLLGVAAGGMLVRRRVWADLGGFDLSLPSIDAALDFSVRARLAGHRVIGVPSARVTSAGPPELFGRKSLSVGAQNRIRRAAQLHRRLSYAPAPAVPLHWLSLVPLAIARSLVHLVAKRPGAVGGEFAAAFAAALDGGVPGARTSIRRTRRMGWGAVGALRMTASDVRERRASERAASLATVGIVPIDRPAFFAGGGGWVTLLAAVLGFVAFGRFADAAAISGGGLLPLSATVGELWSHVGYAWRDVGLGAMVPADPFTVVLAVLGTLTFWAPSFSVVALYLVAVPLSAFTAWWCVARFSTRAWAPAIAAVAWSVAPPLLASLAGGHLGAVIAHILLPTLVVAVAGAARSWSMAAVAGLVFAAVAASAPMIVPVLVVALVAWALANPRGLPRILGIVIPAAALFAPLVLQQLSRGSLPALLAEPGAPQLETAPSTHELVVASPVAGLDGWESFASGLGFAGTTVLVFVLLAPLAALALLSLALPGTRRSVPAMVFALLGFVTAVAGTHLAVTVVGASTTPVWPGAALSVYWLGLVFAAGLALDGLGRSVTIPAIAAAVGVLVLAVPTLVGIGAGSMAVSESNGRLLPAYATAEAASDPSLGTLQLVVQDDGGVAVTVHRGLGTTLDEQSTFLATDTAISDDDRRLATLAGNISSRSGFDVAGELDALHIAFVLVSDATSADQRESSLRVTDALDGNRILTPIGETADGFLWRYADLAPGTAPTGPGPLDSPQGVITVVVQGVVLALTLLLAVPTARRKRVRAARTTVAEPATSGGGGA